MSGAEAIVAVQLIDACIGITRPSLTSDVPSTMLKAYHRSFERFIEDLLERAQETCEEGEVTGDASMIRQVCAIQALVTNRMLQ
ncbi:hypothetical protein LTR49_027710 [Elasticomyces elasticus]|nr:hypothetical protein LTR49_027710 [Elasticomyces elasticus]